MSRMIRRTLAVLATAGLPLAVLGSASAAPAQHDVFTESYSSSQPMTAEENPCGNWSGTLSEVRSGSNKILIPPGGQVDGEFHVNGSVQGSLSLVPDDPNLPSYAGTYREKSTAVFSGFDQEEGDDITRVGRWSLRAVLAGTDGSRLVLWLSGKSTINGQGRVVVDRRLEMCE